MQHRVEHVPQTMERQIALHPLPLVYPDVRKHGIEAQPELDRAHVGAPGTREHHTITGCRRDQGACELVVDVQLAAPVVLRALDAAVRGKGMLYDDTGHGDPVVSDRVAKEDLAYGQRPHLPAPHTGRERKLNGHGYPVAWSGIDTLHQADDLVMAHYSTFPLATGDPHQAGRGIGFYHALSHRLLERYREREDYHLHGARGHAA